MTQVGTTDVNSHTGQKHNHRQRVEKLPASIYTQRRNVLVSSVQQVRRHLGPIGQIWKVRQVCKRKP